MNNSEIINKTYDFIKLHKDDSDEKQQAQMWIRDFLEIFNIPPQKINIGFEWRINIDGSQKYADHLLNGLLLIEMKSRNKKLDKAKSQAYRYVMNLEKEDIPKFVILSNFERIQILDLLDPENSYDIRVEDLHKHLNKFNFLLNKVKDVHIPNNPVNEKAAKLMETLHNNILDLKYPKNASDLLMTRIVFCLFAEDSGIFNRNQFKNYILNETKEDGSDLVDKLATLFQTLNTSISERFQSGVLDEFPYINGGLFEIYQPTGLALNTEVRNNLIKTADLDWSKISPVIFGAMFEGAMDKERRHSLGAHYTSEINIMKVINGLFLNDLRSEFDGILLVKNHNHKIEKLEKFHDKLATLKFLDPACGSGNFLMVAYRELRRLEHEVIDEINQGQTILFDIKDFIKVEINQFHGIEVVPYAISVAKIGLWMMDHLMNKEASDLFGRLYLRLPLHASAKITHADALNLDWSSVVNIDELDYILGNPPFIGQSYMSETQRKQILNLSDISNNVKGIKTLDYVGGWVIKAVELMNINNDIQTAFVATNSLFQGSQALTISKIFKDNNININLAHKTFNWDNNGAKVHVSIVGISKKNKPKKELFTYLPKSKDPVVNIVSHINEYLDDSEEVNIVTSPKPLSKMSPITIGSAPKEGGHLIFDTETKNVLESKYPQLKSYIKRYVGSKEMLHNIYRYILNLQNAPPQILNLPEIKQRLNDVTVFRELKGGKDTERLKDYPTLFQKNMYKEKEVLAIPKTSSIRRKYIPCEFFDKNTLLSDSAYQLIEPTLLEFAILSSRHHAIWLEKLGGKMRTDYRYSNKMVYNTLIIPQFDDKSKIAIENVASEIRNIRNNYYNVGTKLADMYDPVSMPQDLRKAHEKLDKLIDKAYTKQGFKNDKERYKHLVKLYKLSQK